MKLNSFQELSNYLSEKKREETARPHRLPTNGKTSCETNDFTMDTATANKVKTHKDLVSEGQQDRNQPMGTYRGIYPTHR